MKPKYFLISLLSIFVLLSSCYQEPYYHTQVFLVNNSSDTIFCNYKTMKNNSDTLLPIVSSIIKKFLHQRELLIVIFVLNKHSAM
jgi:hypothetical protein